MDGWMSSTFGFKSLLLPQFSTEVPETWHTPSWGWSSQTNGYRFLNFSFRPSFLGQKVRFQRFRYSSHNSRPNFLKLGTHLLGDGPHKQMDVDFWNFRLGVIFGAKTCFLNVIFKVLLLLQFALQAPENRYRGSLEGCPQTNGCRFVKFWLGTILGQYPQKWWFLRLNFLNCLSLNASTWHC